MGAKTKIKNIYIKLLVLFGVIVWSITMVKSGLVYPFGMGFWGPNGHDGVWHITLINHLAKGNWDMPIFAGEALKNYHVGFDLLLALIHKITNIPAQILYFQIFPPIIALLTGVLTYKFVNLWRKSTKEAFWATFFVYFGTSFGWIVTLIRSGQIGGESLFWSQQAISTLINPPFAFSIVLILLGLILILEKRKGIYAILVFGILSQIKIYAGILSLGGLFLAGLYQYKKKNDFRILKIFLGSAFLSVALFLPLNKSANNLLVFYPFWFLETMMGLTDRFYWPRFHEAMVNYRLGNVWLKGTIAYLVAFLIFLFGNMGLRIIKAPLVYRWLKKPKEISSVEIFLLSVILGGIVLPMFVLQAGTPWNTIQFFYYSLTFSGILAGVTLGSFLKKVNMQKRYLIVFVLFLFTGLGAAATLKHYLPARPPAKISNEELQALSFLNQQEDGVVLTYPFDREAAEAAKDNPPRPLYLYESTSYVSAFSQKSVYLEDEVNLDITGYPWGERRSKVMKFLETLNQKEARNFLKEENISYIYWIKGQRAKLGESQLGIEKVFENSEVDIFKVNL